MLSHQRDVLRRRQEGVVELRDQVQLTQHELQKACSEYDSTVRQIQISEQTLKDDEARLVELTQKLELEKQKIAEEHKVTDQLEKTSAQKDAERLAEEKRLKQVEA